MVTNQNARSETRQQNHGASREPTKYKKKKKLRDGNIQKVNDQRQSFWRGSTLRVPTFSK